MKPEWLDRGLIRGPYYTLCLTPEAFDAELKRLDVKDRPVFAKKDACTHFMTHEDGKTCAIVTIKGWEGRDPIAVAGLLVHEAVHIWQEWCIDAGESNTGSETEAYAVQWLSQQLMWEFVRQTGAAK